MGDGRKPGSRRQAEVAAGLATLLVAGAFLLTLLSRCAVEQPGVSDPSYAGAKFVHAGFTKACADCHEKDRKPPPHVATGDCVSCHTPRDDSGGWLPPITGGGSTSSGGYTHPAGLTACVSCHEKDRPAPPHVAAADCVGCHVPSNDNGGWLPLKGAAGGDNGSGDDDGGAAFTHQPPPTSCTGCHESDRPKPPHVAAGDCVGCHSFPNWK